MARGKSLTVVQRGAKKAYDLLQDVELAVFTAQIKCPDGYLQLNKDLGMLKMRAYDLSNDIDTLARNVNSIIVETEESGNDPTNK